MVVHGLRLCCLTYCCFTEAIRTFSENKFAPIHGHATAEPSTIKSDVPLKPHETLWTNSLIRCGMLLGVQSGMKTRDAHKRPEGKACGCCVGQSLWKASQLRMPWTIYPQESVRRLHQSINIPRGNNLRRSFCVEEANVSPADHDRSCKLSNQFGRPEAARTHPSRFNMMAIPGSMVIRGPFRHPMVHSI
jgi:hypothetical protein